MSRRASGLLVLLALVACGGAALRGATDAGSVGTTARVVRIEASRWAYDPDVITLQRGVPVTLELTSNDVHHGFNVPGLGLRADVMPDQITTLRLTPKQAGTFLFHCDYYCGSGHEGMAGQIVVR
jgi:cytochrome c oxidase subunit 2